MPARLIVNYLQGISFLEGMSFSPKEHKCSLEVQSSSVFAVTIIIVNRDKVFLEERSRELTR